MNSEDIVSLAHKLAVSTPMSRLNLDEQVAVLVKMQELGLLPAVKS